MEAGSPESGKVRPELPPLPWVNVGNGGFQKEHKQLRYYGHLIISKPLQDTVGTIRIYKKYKNLCRSMKYFLFVLPDLQRLALKALTLQ